MAVLQKLKTEPFGLPVAISVQNEPDYTPWWNGTEYADGSQWRRLVRKMRKALDANGLGGVILFGPEGSGWSSTVYDEKFLGDKTQGVAGYDYMDPSFEPDSTLPTLNAALGAYAFHSYNRCDAATNRNGFSQYPKDIWMTEWGHPAFSSSNTIPDQVEWAVNGSRGMMADLHIGSHYWFFWLGWRNSTNAVPVREALVSGDQTPVLSKPYHMYDRIWRTLRPGWVVKRMSTDDTSLVTTHDGNNCDALVDLLAFESAGGTASALLMANPTSTGKSMIVSGLKGNAGTVYRTSETQDMNVEAESVSLMSGLYGSQATITLPAWSTTLVLTRGPVSGTVYEAESATLSGPIAKSRTGASGGYIADYTNASADYVEWTVNAPSAGTYQLEFVYANGGTTNRPLEVSLNGTTFGTLNFGPTGGWSTFGAETIQATLNAGSNKVRATAIGSSGPDLDFLKVGLY